MHIFNKRRKEKNRPLFGLSLSAFDPIFVEVVARIGFDVVWVEMEHSGMTMREAENLCRIISGSGMVSMIRIPSPDREFVLKAAEIGPDILMLPMVNDTDIAGQFVRHARYAPRGQRGFYNSSRASNYGIFDGSIAELRRSVDERLMLWAQIETRGAVERMTEICNVQGIDGLFMGAGDLSADMGIVGDTEHPAIMESTIKAVEISHGCQKVCCTVSKSKRIHYWQQHEIDALFVGNNVNFYINSARQVMDQIQEQLEIVDEPNLAAVTPAK